MITKDLSKKLEKVETLSKCGRIRRLLNNPVKYTYAILLKNALYPIFQKETLVSCRLFTGRKIKVRLPASTDIYLTGGKSHFSEIKLAKFLILNLKNKATFWDIGAHYGYFSLIASEIVGQDGQIIAIEASPTTFKLLKENTDVIANINALNNAISDNNEKVDFYEMPNLYSEYNSTDISQFKKERWFSKIKVTKVFVDAITMDHLFKKYPRNPDIIKIDVEGGEVAAINGTLNLLEEKTKSPIIVMEFLEPKRNNKPHKEAANTLKMYGYQTYIIQDEGSLILSNNIEKHLLSNNLESDNIVFKKEDNEK